MSGNSPFDPSKCGLWAAVAWNGAIKPGGWMNAEAAGEVIGTCRSCGGYLVAAGPETGPPPGWYTARCISCAHEYAAPGGRVLRRSARASERNVGE